MRLQSIADLSGIAPRYAITFRLLATVAITICDSTPLLQLAREPPARSVHSVKHVVPSRHA